MIVQLRAQVLIGSLLPVGLLPFDLGKQLRIDVGAFFQRPSHATLTFLVLTLLVAEFVRIAESVRLYMIFNCP